MSSFKCTCNTILENVELHCNHQKGKTNLYNVRYPTCILTLSCMTSTTGSNSLTWSSTLTYLTKQEHESQDSCKSDLLSTELFKTADKLSTVPHISVQLHAIKRIYKYNFQSPPSRQAIQPRCHKIKLVLASVNGKKYNKEKVWFNPSFRSLRGQLTVASTWVIHFVGDNLSMPVKTSSWRAWSKRGLCQAGLIFRMPMANRCPKRMQFWFRFIGAKCQTKAKAEQNGESLLQNHRGRYHEFQAATDN